MAKARKGKTSGRKRRSATKAAKRKTRPKAKSRARRPKRTTKARARVAKPPKRARETRAKARPAPAAAPVEEGLRDAVVAALVRNGYVPPDEILVDVVTAVAAGYRKGPATAPVRFASEAEGAVAEGFAEIYRLGDRSPGPDRATHFGSVRRFVDFDFEQMGPEGVGSAERDVLARVALGIWKPDVHLPSQKHMFVAPVCRWYRAGR